MADISLKDILNLIQDAAGQAFERRNDPKYWSANFKPEEGDEVKGTVESVSFEPKTGLRLELRKGDRKVTLEARPSSIQKSKVFVDDALDSDARVVAAYKGGFGNPTRWGFDFKHVTLDGEEYRVDTRFDP